jgi:hypothetical protein
MRNCKYAKIHSIELSFVLELKRIAANEIQNCALRAGIDRNRPRLRTTEHRHSISNFLANIATFLSNTIDRKF